GTWFSAAHAPTDRSASDYVGSHHYDGYSGAPGCAGNHAHSGPRFRSRASDWKLKKGEQKLSATSKDGHAWSGLALLERVIPPPTAFQFISSEYGRSSLGHAPR